MLRYKCVTRCMKRFFWFFALFEQYLYGVGIRLLKFVGIAAHFLRKLVYASHFGRDINALRTMLVAHLAANTMVCLTEFRHTAVVADEVGTAVLGIFRVFLAAVWHYAVIDALVEMAENGRDVQTVRARHAVVAFVAWYGFEVVNLVSDGHKQLVLLLGDRVKG